MMIGQERGETFVPFVREKLVAVESFRPFPNQAVEGQVHATSPRAVLGVVYYGRGGLRCLPFRGVRGRASMGPPASPAWSPQSADREASRPMAVDQPGYSGGSGPNQRSVARVSRRSGATAFGRKARWESHAFVSPFES